MSYEEMVAGGNHERDESLRSGRTFLFPIVVSSVKKRTSGRESEHTGSYQVPSGGLLIRLTVSFITSKNVCPFSESQSRPTTLLSFCWISRTFSAGISTYEPWNKVTAGTTTRAQTIAVSPNDLKDPLIICPVRRNRRYAKMPVSWV